MKARCADRDFDLDIREGRGGDRVLVVNGEEHSLEARRSGEGGWLLRIGDRSWEAWVVGTAGGEIDVAIRGRTHAVSLDDPRRYDPREAAAVVADGWVELRSTMPGKVVAVLAREGEEVEAGQAVVVVEAMKMENEFLSPRKGKLVRLPVAAGEAVEAGALLAAIE